MMKGFSMRCIKFVIIIVFLFQISPQIVSMEVPVNDLALGTSGQAGAEQRLGEVFDNPGNKASLLFDSIKSADLEQSCFLVNSDKQRGLLEQLQSGRTNQQLEQSNIGLDRPKQFLTGHDALVACCGEIRPIVRSIKKATDDFYTSERLSKLQEAESRQAMRIGESFFEAILRRLNNLNERLVAPVVLENEQGSDLMRREIKLRVARARIELLSIKKNLVQFFKILANQPCNIGDPEPVEMRLLAQHLAHKFDANSVPELTEWAHIICKWYNKFFTKEGEQPLQLPEWLKPSARHNEVAQDNDKCESFPQEGDRQRSVEDSESGEQSVLLQQAIRVEEMNGDRIIGAGGANRQLHEFKKLRDNAGGVINSALKKIQEKFKNLFKPAPKSGFFKRFILYGAACISNKVACVARWIAYKTWLNKKEFERTSWQNTAAGEFWSEKVLPGWPEYKRPQAKPTAPRRWWHRLIFWKRSGDK